MLIKLLVINLILGISIYAKSINIAVAANVSYAMPQLIDEFHKLHKDIDVKVVLGSSGKLTAQIKHGAPFDLFISANMRYPQSLYSDKIAITTPKIYAQGALVYLSVKRRDFTKGIEILTQPDISKIAIANPKTAPYGKAAIEAIKSSGIYDKIAKKIIYAESASQTVIYTTKATDIGLIAKSSLYSPHLSIYKKGINWIDVDPKLYNPIDQGMVILKRGEGSKKVKSFYDFMLSDSAKMVLKRFGYILP
jgi:molybdate transport system substrate-binding protein